MGPLRLLDEVGFDVAGHAAESLHRAYGARMTPSDALGPLTSRERLGKKTGQGFYFHPKAGGRSREKPSLCLDLSRFQGSDHLKLLSDREALDRCLLAMLAEAVRCLEEEVVAGPVELDIATVMGMGFAPFRGGLMRFADGMGLRVVLDRLHALAGTEDIARREGGPERFTPPALLVQNVEAKRGFHD
jgi:3-hydroxyacyl-CoA dehydrogenase/enoyl-CoA hydratase/3-hydroxybutyryl-CoA epimerase